jgi:hypothetical protein
MYLENYDDWGYCVKQTNDGGYIICGPTSSFGQLGTYIIKTDGNGIEEWYKIFGSCRMGRSIQQTQDGGYIILGWNAGNSYEICLIKTDGNGDITSIFNIPTTNSIRNLEKVVDLLGRENKPQTNTPFIEIYDDGSIEKKIVID